MTPNDRIGRPVRVIIADDSELSRLVLREILSTDPGIEVIGTAATGRDAVELTIELQPDIVTVDLRMPDQDGLTTAQHIMQSRPTPVIVVTSSDFWQRKEEVFASFKYGVLDVIEKPSSAADDQAARVLVDKVKLLSRVRVSGTVWPRMSRRPSLQLTARPPAADRRILLLGASTGGPKALHQVLGALPADLPVPVLVVQHMSPGFVEGFAEWLTADIALDVRVAQTGDAPAAGKVLLAPGGLNLVMDRRGRLRTNDDPAPQSVRPSVDLLFSSVAPHYGAGAIAVVLTGIGKDGRQGMIDIKAAGGTTLVQDEASSVVFGMPGAALDAGVVDEVVAIEAMGLRLLELLRIPAARRGE